MILGPFLSSVLAFALVVGGCGLAELLSLLTSKRRRPRG